MTTVYLADLTHLTITLSNDSFPLNAGLVAAYAKKKHPDIEVQIFKYPHSLKEALDQSLPDILGLSNYPWNTSLNRTFLKYVKSTNQNILTVMGGPNISYDATEQKQFLKQLESDLDFYIMYEGESGFDALLTKGKACNFDIGMMKEMGVPGSIYTLHGRFIPLNPIERNRNLDDFPSPYLNGLLDKFFDNRLSPIIETHRGCPFKCTYCHEGHDSYQQVNRFGTKRIEDEINYISKRIGKVVKNLMIADPNFGMFDRDISLSRAISDSRKRYGYPTTVFATTAKNRKKKLIAINQELDDIVMPIWMSVQSMNDETLVNIKRKNIRIEDMISVKDALSGKSALSKSELIIPLPGETLSSHKSALVNLMELGISSIICYQLMLVEGSEHKTDKIKRKEHKLHTSFRVLPRSFTKMDNLDMSLEIEEIAVSTRDFSFPDYLEARQLHLIIATCYNGGAFSGFFRLLKEQEKLFPTFLDELRLSLIENHEFRLLIEKFIFDTERELFTSKQALLEYYRSDDNFQKLISGEDGANLIQKYTSLALLQHHETIISAFEKVCLRILSNERDSMSKLLELGGYYRLLFKDFLVSERVNIINTKQFSYDFGAWLSSIKLLEQYRFDSPVEVTFYTSQNQYDMLESYFERYGQSDQSLGKILTRLNVTDLLRQQKKNITV